jgi:hypothetical protein
MATLDFLRRHDFGLRLVGIGTNQNDHYAFQRRLLERTGEHYMGIQVLCSMLSNCLMLCISGSSNLFAILPTKNVVLSDRYLQMVVTDLPEDEHRIAASAVDVPAEVVRQILSRRYGPVAERILVAPWQDPYRAMASIRPFISDIIQAMWRQQTSVVRFEQYLDHAA